MPEVQDLDVTAYRRMNSRGGVRYGPMRKLRGGWCQPHIAGEPAICGEYASGCEIRPLFPELAGERPERESALEVAFGQPGQLDTAWLAESADGPGTSGCVNGLFYGKDL